MKNTKWFSNRILGCLLVSLAIPATALARDEECKTGPAVVAKMTRQGAEELTCLDAFVSGERAQALVLSTLTEETSTGGRKETNALYVVSARAAADGKTIDAIDSQTPIADPALFPNGCGQYLKGALILPGSTKIAMIYARSIRSVDYADPAKLVITVLNDQHVPGMASTCEGYTPNWRGGRDGLTVDAEKHALSLKITERKEVEQPEEKKLSAAGRKFYARAYFLECAGDSPEKGSPTCLDLKRAKDDGVFVVRRMVRPVKTLVMDY